MRTGWLLLVLASGTSAARAQELRELCAERPGLGRRACTVDPGHLQLELGLADWTLERQPGERTDTVLGPDLLARFGVADRSEIRFGWTSVGHVRDRQDGQVTRQTRVGDVTLGFKQRLTDPDNKAYSLAVIASAQLPAGRPPVGAGTWGMTFEIPATVKLTDLVRLQLMPEVDARPDEDGGGRHLAYSGVLTASITPSDDLEFDAEVAAERDRDPMRRETSERASFAVAYRPRRLFQLDAGAIAGLNRYAPDVELYAGVTTKF